MSPLIGGDSLTEQTPRSPRDHVSGPWRNYAMAGGANEGGVRLPRRRHIMWLPPWPRLETGGKTPRRPLDIDFRMRLTVGSPMASRTCHRPILVRPQPRLQRPGCEYAPL